MLCEACQAMFSCETPCFDTLTQHHGTLAAFQSAAASKCQICRMLWGRVPIDDPETLSAVREDSKTHYTLEERADKRIGLRIISEWSYAGEHIDAVSVEQGIPAYSESEV